MKRILLLLLVLSGFSSFSSHLSSAYFEYRVDSNNILHLELHIFRDKGGIAFNFPNLNVQGPTNVMVIRNDARTRDIFYPEPNCASPLAFTEYIYEGTFDLNTVNADSNGITFSYSAPCCLRNTENLQTNGNLYVEFQVFPLLNNGIYSWIEFSTIRANKNPIVRAYSNVQNISKLYDPTYLQGIDSLSHILDNPLSASSTPHLFNSGYSGSFPLPDITEDVLNGPVTLTGSRAELSFGARKGSFTPGYYVYSKKTEHFLTGALISVDRNMGAAIIEDIDTTAVPVRVEYTDANGGFLIGQNHPQFNYSLAPGDTLDLNFLASPITGGQDSIIMFVKTTGVQVPNDPSFTLPQFIEIPFSPIGFVNTREVRMIWIPSAANFQYNTGPYFFDLTFKRAECLSEVRLIRIKVDLLSNPFISLGQQQNGSVQLCDGASSPIQFVTEQINGFHWSPGAWVTDSTKLQTTLLALNNGWLYAKNGNGRALDSIFVESGNSGSQYALSRNNNQIQYSDPGNSESQTWTISNAISFKGNSEDVIPILGAGSYSVISEGDAANCDSYSDTLDIAQDFIYGSNFVESRLAKSNQDSIKVIQGSKGKAYRLTMAMPNEARIIEELYFPGIRNTNPFKTASVLIHVRSRNGYSKIDTLDLGFQEYLRFPVNFQIDPTHSADIILGLPEGTELQMLKSDDLNITINAARYVVFRELVYLNNGTGQISYDSTSLRFPLGIKYQGTVDLIEQAPETSFQIFPNPARDHLYLLSNEEWESESYLILDAQGRVKQQGELNGIEAHIALKGLRPGFYFIQIGNNRKALVLE